jgi:hypothetical protein
LLTRCGSQVGLDELESRPALKILYIKILNIGRIERVEIVDNGDPDGWVLADKCADKVAADKPGAPGDYVMTHGLQNKAKSSKV